MTPVRNAYCAAALVATALLVGCTAQATTPSPSRIALAGGGIEITAAPLPTTAFTACGEKIAADKAARKARDAKARAARAAARAARIRRANATTGSRASGRNVRRVRTCPYCGRVLRNGEQCPRGTSKNPWPWPWVRTEPPG